MPQPSELKRNSVRHRSSYNKLPKKAVAITRFQSRLSSLWRILFISSIPLMHLCRLFTYIFVNYSLICAFSQKQCDWWLSLNEMINSTIFKQNKTILSTRTIKKQKETLTNTFYICSFHRLFVECELAFKIWLICMPYLLIIVVHLFTHWKNIYKKSKLVFYCIFFIYFFH